MTDIAYYAASHAIRQHIKSAYSNNQFLNLVVLRAKAMKPSGIS